MTILIAALVAREPTAQTASYAFSGTGCTGGRLLRTMGPVPLSVRGLPRIGQTFEVLSEGSHSYIWDANRLTFLLTGVSNTSANGFPLPVDISQFFPGEPYCGLLRTSADISVRMPFTNDPLALVSLSISIPNAPALLGVGFYQQVLSWERTTFGPPFRAASLSRGGIGTIGR